MAFKRVCVVSDVAPGDTLKINQLHQPVALFNVDGEIFAIHDTCSHGEWSLSDGYLDGDIVECSLHMGKFCVRDGRAVGLPATAPVAAYPVRVEGNEVFVDLDAGSPQ